VKNKTPTILEVMDHVFAKWFAGESWLAWRVFLAALFALPMSQAELAIYTKHTGRITPPTMPAREAWVCCGRRAGKSIVAALISTYLSAFRDWTPFLGPGEVATAMCVSPDRRQSRIIGRFQRGLVRSVPMIAAMVSGETKEGFELSNRTVCEVQTADPATLRGYVSHLIVNDEIAFLPTESSASPDAEILIAERPCLASLPGSLLLSISSPYARRGSLYEAFQNHYAKDGDPVLFWKGASLDMNPTLDEKIIDAAFEADPQIAQAEWAGDFRSDCERLFTEEMLDAVTDHDRPLILPPVFEEETA
jgi:hypothetical protein